MEEKIEGLLAQLTLEEKVSLIAGVDMWHTAAVPRIGIPAIKMTDGPVGARGAGGDSGPSSACFPPGVALAATWNPDLVRRVGEALGQETRAKGAAILLAPTVNIHRSPLAGRNFECYSEDPFLSGQMASAYIQGVQSQGVSACIKHFVCNDSEYKRHSLSSEVSERALREIYLRPFETALRQAHPWALMSAYNKLNGTWCSENPRLLEEILKQEWGFDGLVISDWLGTYSQEAAKGGLDLEMPGPGRWLGARVLQMVEAGEISLEQIDQKVRRLLRLIERVGALSTPPNLNENSIDLPEQRALARQAAAECIVLLKNQDHLLPIDPERVHSIAVIGANARWPQVLAGGSAYVNPHYVISPLQGLQARAGDKLRIDYAPGCYLNRSLPLLDINWLEPDAQGRKGYLVQVYNDLDFSTAPSGTWFTNRSSISWYEGNLPGASLLHFSAKLTATMIAPENGEYCFGVLGNGRTRLLLDGKTLFDSQAIQGADVPPDPDEIVIQELSAVTVLQAGQRVQLEFQQIWDGSSPWVNLRLACLPPRPGESALISEAIELARKADIALVFAGNTLEWESESFDRPDMDLPGLQNELIEQVASANPNTIVVLNSGAPLNMPWLERVSGVLQSWYGGQEAGAAIAAVLFGETDACGRLPITFPRRLQDTPSFLNYPGENGRVYYGEGLFVGYRYYDKKEILPLFPFGFGLSYTTFEIFGLELDQTVYHKGETIHVRVMVTNTGSRQGREVVQLYLRDKQSSLVRPDKELKGFQAVDLQPGETRQVEFVLDEDALAFYDDALPGWTSENGLFEVLVGSSVQKIWQTVSFEWKGGGALRNPGKSKVLDSGFHAG